MALKFHNTLTRSLVPFTPLTAGKVHLYTCGPTVYNRVHIGNLRTFVWEDVLCRALRYLGFETVQVMNLTDIDDKTIRGAIQEGITLKEFTARHVETFFEDLATLNVSPAAHYPRATDHIPEMVEIVKKLTERGHTYESDGSIWFRIASFPSYGKLARVDLSSMQRGARVADDEYEKEDVRDFAVWKGWKEGEPESATWTTELGKGRPGWHLECSAMSMKYLGETLDIHTGAVDNIFPHHENEIAQSEGATGKEFVRYWLHAEHLIVDGEKMAKSKGNFFTVPDLLSRGHSPRAIRYLFLSVPYRQKLNFTFESLAAAASAVARLESLDLRLGERARSTGASAIEDGVEAKISSFQNEFREGLEDDLNTAAALGALFSFVREANADLESGQLSPAGASAFQRALRGADSVLGVLPKAEAGLLDSEIQAKIDLRQAARKRRDFAAADAIRDELAALGITLEDTPAGVRWRRKS
ncbi:MAG: cysteine--tRNA ligase [Acidobacteria bacterium]|nr:cysteine--tRNA ligase [Acidobacteriota bacterium]